MEGTSVILAEAEGGSNACEKRRKSYSAHAGMGIISSVRPMELSALRSALGDTFTYGEARRSNVSNRMLYRLRDSEQIFALGGGVYRWADAPPADDDLIELSERVPQATLCLESALARHRLVDSIPPGIDVAVPRGNSRPRLRAPVWLHQFDPATFEIGRELLDTGSRKPVGIYSVERSIIDMIRLRHHQGSDLAWEALRGWLQQPGHSPGQLIALTQHFPSTETPLRRALEIIQ